MRHLVTHLSPQTCVQPPRRSRSAPARPIPQCSAGELSPLVHRPPSSASLCTHPRRRSKAPDPKEKVKEWKKQMRGEERKLDRQITSEGCAPGCHARRCCPKRGSSERGSRPGSLPEARVTPAERDAPRHKAICAQSKLWERGRAPCGGAPGSTILPGPCRVRRR